MGASPSVSKKHIPVDRIDNGKGSYLSKTNQVPQVAAKDPFEYGICMCAYIHICVNMYVCMYVCMYINIYISICRFKNMFRYLQIF
jgi:hypothetical protein